MALVINDRVKETTTTTGTGAVSLGGAVTGFETFAAGIGNSNTTYYCIAHQDQAEFEVGLGTLDGDSSDLTRTTIISSSNSDSAVDFSAGTKDVFCTIPASKMLFKDASGTIGNFNAATITANTAFVPDASDGAALGTSSLEFSDLFLADGAVINFGDDQDITLTHTADTGLATNGTFQATTITATTAFVPDASDGAALGTSSLEFSDLFLADGAVINFGDDQDINITHVADTGLTTNGDFSVGDDLTVLGGVIEFKSNSGSPASLKMYCESSNAHFQTLQPQPHSASAANTLRLPNSGDSGTQDLVAVDITQTLTNKTLTTPTINGATIGSSNLATASNGDINVAPNGTGKVVIRGNDNQGKIVLNCEANTHGQTIIAAPHSESANNVLTLPSTGGDARIVSTASTATLTNKTITASSNSVGLAPLDIDGGTDIGADLADADLIIVDDGAGGTNRKAALSRVKTYIGDPTALAIALG